MRGSGRPFDQDEPEGGRPLPTLGRRDSIRISTQTRSTQTPPRPAQPRSVPPGSQPSPAKTPVSVERSSTGRSTAVLAAGTLASRLTGFARVLAIGYVLGVSPLSDAFNYANGIPNIIYDLLLGGILAATLIPVFVEHLASEDAQETSHSISAVLTAISAGLVVASALLWVLAPYVIDFYLVLEHGSAAVAERTLATRLLRYFAPQVFFLGATVASTAVLNARRRFVAAAFSPVINNAVAIAALIAAKVVAGAILAPAAIASTSSVDAFAADSRAIMVLGAGTTLGYGVQLLIQLPSMHRLGLKLRPVWDPRHPAVRRVGALSGWIVGVVVTNQASLALVLILAGRTKGGVTAYQFAYQFFQLPNALVAVSVASAIMPDLAERWSSGAKVSFERQFLTALRVTLAILIPLCVVYLVVAQPLVALAIHHGAVSGSGTRLVTSTLVAFIAGLPGFAAFFLLMRVYQATQDAKGMFRIYVIENTLTVVAAFGMNVALGVPGLALAWVAPYSVAAVWAVVDLKRRAGSFGGWLTVRALARITIAAALAGGGAFAVGLAFTRYRSDPLLAARIAAQVVAAVGIYSYVGSKLHVRELLLLTRPLRRLASTLLGR